MTMPRHEPVCRPELPASFAAAPQRVWRRYGEYLRRPPLLTVEWADPETSARGWLVINSLRGGAAGGGTRMRRAHPPRGDYLAKTMELKFAFSGPPIGGAKSGIDFDPPTRAARGCCGAGSRPSRRTCGTATAPAATSTWTSCWT
jgi:hypothetical protein